GIEPRALGGRHQLRAPAERVERLPERLRQRGIARRRERGEGAAEDPERQVVALLLHVRARDPVEAHRVARRALRELLQLPDRLLDEADAPQQLDPREAGIGRDGLRRLVRQRHPRLDPRHSSTGEPCRGEHAVVAARHLGEHLREEPLRDLPVAAASSATSAFWGWPARSRSLPRSSWSAGCSTAGARATACSRARAAVSYRPSFRAPSTMTRSARSETADSRASATIRSASSIAVCATPPRT